MKPDLRKKIYAVLDVIMSEYGWSLEYCLSLPCDVIFELYKTINNRQLNHTKLWTKLISAASAAGFSGKIDKLDSIFKVTNEEPETKEVAEMEWKSQLKGLWLRLGRPGDEFDKKWESGEKIEL